MIDALRQDVRAAARNIARYPIAFGVAVLSLAGGIGATTATLVIRDVVFRRPPALYRRPAELSKVQVGSPDRPIMPIGSPVPGALFAAWRGAGGGAIAGGTAAAATPEVVRALQPSDRTDTLRVRGVTADFFTVLGVDAALGRSSAIGPGDVVLSHRVWQALFDGRADAIGATIFIDTRPHVVAGVMPERFWFSAMNSPVWIGLDAGAAASEPALEVVVRRAGGVSHEALARELETGLARYAATRPAGQRDLRLRVSGIEGTPLGQNVSIALPWLLSVCVLLTLLIACANVAILVIAQWTAREHEIAIRASLGASRGRIVQFLLTESTLIALAGGAFGVLATFALRGLIVSRAGVFVRFFDLSIDPATFLLASLITFAAGLVSGVGPALLETRRLHGNPMRTMGASEGARQRWRHTLVVMEIAVTIALLVVTAGMVSLYQRSLSSDVGYRTAPLLMMRVTNAGGVPVARVLDAVRAMPGVAGAAATNSAPFYGFGPLQRVAATAGGATELRAERVTASPEFFATLDVPMRSGRAFTAQDTPAARVVIVNERLAARLFPGQNPIGWQLWSDGTAYDVVGVVATYMNGALQDHRWDAKFFVPLDAAAGDRDALTFLIRATSDPIAVLRALRGPVRDAAAGNILASANTVHQIMDVAGQEILVGTAPLAPLIATGMLLTAAGIYGVLAFAITRRSKELAVRIAIGASGRDLVRLVAAHSVRLVAIGVGCGVGATFALSRVVRASGGAGSFLDPPWQGFVVPVVIVLAIALVATWVPSRRALTIDPAVLLRST